MSFYSYMYINPSHMSFYNYMTCATYRPNKKSIVSSHPEESFKNPELKSLITLPMYSNCKLNKDIIVNKNFKLSQLKC